MKKSKSPNTPDALIILSGGLDSVVQLHNYRKRIALAVSFDYGANNNAREIEMARINCERLGIEHIVISLDFMRQYFQSSLFEGADAVPEKHDPNGKPESTVVPFRNGIMLAIACGLAESRGLHTVMIANHAADDHAVPPDCRKHFINAMSDAMYFGTYDGVNLMAPYTHITKDQIVEIGHKCGVDFALTYSCYRGGAKHCGKCGTCIERKMAFQTAGIPDPTEYEQ